MKKLPAILIMSIALSFCGCSNSMLDSATKETSDQPQSTANNNDKYVLMVKQGHHTDYENSTYDDAFEKFFTSPTWKYLKADDGKDIVEFTGECTYQEVKVEARLQFTLDVKGEKFETGSLYFNEVPQSQLVTSAVFSEIFEGKIPKTTETKETKEIPKDQSTTNNTKGKEISINQELQKKLNIFISNFAEVPADMYFSEGKASDKQLILFGFWHYYRNYGRKEPYFQVKDSYCSINKKYIETAVKKYYNISKINHQTIKIDSNYSYEFKNNCYYLPCADGDNPIDYSVVYKVEDIGENKFYVYAKNYHNSEFTTKLPADYDYYSLNFDKAEKIYKDAIKNYKTEIVVAKIQQMNDKYILLEYKLQ